MKNDDKKPKRPPGPFNFCPKHNVFFKSCGCAYDKKRKSDDDTTYVEEKK